MEVAVASGVRLVVLGLAVVLLLLLTCRAFNSAVVRWKNCVLFASLSRWKGVVEQASALTRVSVR